MHHTYTWLATEVRQAGRQSTLGLPSSYPWLPVSAVAVTWTCETPEAAAPCRLLMQTPRSHRYTHAHAPKAGWDSPSPQ